MGSALATTIEAEEVSRCQGDSADCTGTATTYNDQYLVSVCEACQSSLWAREGSV